MKNEKKSPLISVVVPAYNIEDCLERCVNSIREQTYPKLEILLVDDGSTDGTGALCDRLAGEDIRIRVFHKANGGSSSARNLGIGRASGEWIGFVDSDDWIEPDMYEKLLSCTLSGGVDIVQVSRDEIDEEGKKRPDVCVPPETDTFCEAADFMRELLLHRGDCSFCTKLLKRELFESRRFPEGELNEDFRLLIGLLSDVKGVCILPQQLYHVYYRMGSNTRRRDKDDFSRVFTDIVVNADFAEELVKRRWPTLKREAARFGLYQRLDYLLHIPVGRMNGEDAFYGNVKKYLREHLWDTFTNPYLTLKNRLYLTLLTVAPKTVRRVHGQVMRMKGKDAR